MLPAADAEVPPWADGVRHGEHLQEPLLPPRSVDSLGSLLSKSRLGRAGERNGQQHGIMDIPPSRISHKGLLDLHETGLLDAVP